MPDAEWGGLPFDEQIKFFQDKLILPTKHWTDLWEGQHARAFVVAGAAREDLLTGLHAAVDKAIAKGTTLAEFRQDFDAIVGKTGWTYEGARGWRTRVIYETNLRTSYQAGRYAQMKALAERRPYWRYRHSDASVRARPHHKRWDGTILRHDDPWWGAHYPPNGWGCKCFVETLSEREMQATGRTGPDPAPLTAVVERTVGTGDHARKVLVPAGIDPGWAYHPGEQAWGSNSEPGGEYVRVKTPVQTDAAKMGLGDLAVDHAPALQHISPATEAEARKVLVEALGGHRVDVTLRTPGFSYGVHVDVDHLAKKLRDRKTSTYMRARFVPWLRETLENPAEVWAQAFRNNEGRMAVRLHFIRVIQEDIATARPRPMLIVVDAQRARLVAWNVMPRQIGDLKVLRSGLLLYRRP